MFNPVNRPGRILPPRKDRLRNFTTDDYKPPTEDYLVVDVLAVADDVYTL